MIRAVSVERDFEDRLAALSEAGLLRRPRLVSGAGTRVLVDGRSAINFSSNDYLGLASHPRLVGLAALAPDDDPAVGAGASRLISGTRPAHLAAERRLARLVGRPAALLFSTGYAANVGALSAILEPGDVAFSDALNHASLIDGLRLSRALVQVYPHRDLDRLEALLRARRHEGRRAWIVTDALFSMDGDLAPLAALRALADAYDAGLFVDEAHSLGVCSGSGACADARVVPDALVGTLGKAFGLAGAFVAGSAALRTLLENRARSYVFSTAPPPALAEAILVAADLVEQADERRATARAHADRLRDELGRQGWEVPPGDGPIVPVPLGTPGGAMRASSRLLERGYFVRGIRPPTVPAGTSRLRIVPTAIHTEPEIDGLLESMGELRALAPSETGA